MYRTPTEYEWMDFCDARILWNKGILIVSFSAEERILRIGRLLDEAMDYKVPVSGGFDKDAVKAYDDAMDILCMAWHEIRNEQCVQDRFAT